MSGERSMGRRDFLGAIATGAAGLALPAILGAQQQPERISSATNAPMNDSAHRPVRLPSKGTGPSMDARERDALEKTMACVCGCVLDIFTCRTTDFSCQLSPAMHRDVVALVEGGYSAAEIRDAFEAVYGERVLMAPRKQGFNWAGYVTPFVAMGGGAALVVAFIRKWHRGEPAAADTATPLPLDASPEEMARLEAALRDDSR